MPRANSAEVRKSIGYMRDVFKGDGFFVEITRIGGQSINPNYTMSSLNIYNVNKQVPTSYPASHCIAYNTKNIDLSLYFIYLKHWKIQILF